MLRISLTGVLLQTVVYLLPDLLLLTTTINEVTQTHAAATAVIRTGAAARDVRRAVLHLGLGAAFLCHLIALDKLLRGGTKGVDLLFGHALVEVPVRERLAVPEFVKVAESVIAVPVSVNVNVPPKAAVEVTAKAPAGPVMPKAPPVPAKFTRAIPVSTFAVVKVADAEPAVDSVNCSKPVMVRVVGAA